MTVGIDQFFASVFPRTGRYCVSIEAKQNMFVSSVEEATRLASRDDSNVYFAPASFSADTRTDEHVALRRSFTLDVDVRASKPDHYHTTKEALTDFARLVADNKVPAPMWWVATGSGLQIHWVADEDLDKDQWRVRNNALLNHLATVADPRALTDLGTSRRASGVLRVPGTVNHKHRELGPLPARVLGGQGPHLSPEWVARLANAPDAPVAAYQSLYEGSSASGYPAIESTEPLVFSSPLPEYARVHADARAAVPTIANRSTEITLRGLVRHCAIVRQMHERAKTPRALSNPVWMLYAQLMTYSATGRRDFHRISVMDPAQYQPTQADALFSRMDAMKNGITCEHMRMTVCGGDSKLCQGCPQFKPNGGSPLNVGRVGYAPPVAAPLLGERLTDPFSGRVIDIQPDISRAMPAWMQDGRSKFGVSPNGMLMQRVYSMDPNTQQFVLDAEIELDIFPFWLAHIWGGEHNEDGTRVDSVYEYAYQEPGGSPISIRVPASSTATAAEVVKFFVAGGLTFPEKQMPAMKECIGYNTKKCKLASDTRGLQVEAFGWDESEGRPTFTAGNIQYFGHGKARIVRLSSDAAAVGYRTKFGRKGTMEKQIESLKLMESDAVRDVSRLAYLLGMGGVLFKLTGLGSGIGLLTGSSGLGKSTVLRNVSSAWGAPNEKTMDSDDTAMGMQAMMGTLRHLPMCFDEVMTAEAAFFRKFAMRSSATRGRNRATTSGSLNEFSAEWSTVILASSNTTIAGFIPGIDDESEAARKRVLELQYEGEEHTTAAGEHSDIQTRIEQIAGNFGWLGPFFIDYVLTNLAKVKASISTYRKKWGEKLGGSTERFESMMMAVAETTGDIIAEMGWMDSMTWTTKNGERIIAQYTARHKAEEAEKATPSIAGQETYIPRFGGDSGVSATPTRRAADYRTPQDFFAGMVGADRTSIFRVKVDGKGDRILTGSDMIHTPMRKISAVQAENADGSFTAYIMQDAFNARCIRLGTTPDAVLSSWAGDPTLWGTDATKPLVRTDLSGLCPDFIGLGAVSVYRLRLS